MAELSAIVAAAAAVVGGAAAAAGCPGLAALVAFPAAREGFGALANVANEVLGSSLYDRLRDRNSSTAANHDLQRLVRSALDQTISSAARRQPRFSSDRRKLRRIGRKIRSSWGQLTNQQTLFRSLDERNIARWFAYGAEQEHQASPIVQADADWQRLASDLSIEVLGYGRPSQAAMADMAESLKLSLFENVRRIIKHDFARGGRAYAALQLDFMRLLMNAVVEIQQQLARQGELTRVAIEELRGAREGISRGSTLCWDSLNDAARTALVDVKEKIDQLAGDLRAQLDSIEVSLRRIEAVVMRESVETSRREPPFHLPLASIGQDFKGREGDLVRLKQLLVAESDTEETRTCVIHGLGGVGKTRLAIEFARRHRAEFTAVLHARADTPDRLRSSIASISGAATLGLPFPADSPDELRFEAVLGWLNGNPGWLLVLDNVDTPLAANAVRELRGRLAGGKLLITAQYSDWAAGITRLRLDALSNQAAAEFLLGRTEGLRVPAPDDQDVAERIASECFDGFPLMLEQAAATIAFERRSLGDYLSEWLSASDRCLEWYDEDASDYPRALAATWELAIRRLSGRALGLLRVASLLAPDPIPLAILADSEKQAAGLLRREAAEATATPVGAGQSALGELERFALVRTEAGTVVIHRLVQNVVRSRIPADSRSDWVRLAVASVSRRLPNPRNEPSSWAAWEQSHAHVGILMQRADEELHDGSHRQLMHDFASFLQTRALYDEAERLMRRSIALLEASGGSVSPQMGSFLNNFATLLRERDQHVEAERVMRRSLSIAEECDPPNVSLRLSNMSVLLVETERCTEAVPLARRALSLAEERLRPDHPDISFRLHNLARPLHLLGQNEEAERLVLRAIQVAEAAHGGDDYRLAQRKSLLADILQSREDLDEVLTLRTEVLRIYAASFPPGHPWVKEAERQLAALKTRLDRR